MQKINRHSLHLASFALAGCCLCASFVSCCGYHFGQNTGLQAIYSTISIPYVEGDVDGSLTAAIIKEFVRSGVFEYRQTGGSLLLNISLIDFNDENIGFRYDRRKSGEMRKSIIPTETRRTSVVEVSVENAASGCVVLGPARFSASVDFDHDYEYARDEVNVFSLGQLSDIDQACDAVQTPLNKVLANKIVDYVTHSW